MAQKVKCVVVGDGEVGKTSMLMSYVEDKFPGEYVPTVFDSYSATKTVDGKSISLKLMDTAGQEDFDQIRHLSYPDTDVFLICFSVVQRSSLDHVFEKWVKEIQQHQPDSCSLLIGTKIDLRGKDPEKIAKSEGEKAKKEIPNCKKYMECSALTLEGLKEVFDEAIRVVLYPSSDKAKGGKKKGGGGGGCMII
ncbi:rho-related protein rac1A-like isoform X2 [Convolutriloba macropyga]|uniref:rho-related protein rac1A-like isoform X2 n=1 Tax=Convolutriloba macropyga TaxID=536237 RepID=UPI003F51B1EF